MAKDRAALFEEKQRLVALFRAQLTLLAEADPDGMGPHLGAVDLSKYDALIAEGTSASWPAGLLPGLRDGIRDAQFMLDLAYGPQARGQVRTRLRALAGDAVDILATRDAELLAGILRRGRIRTPNEYFLVRTAIDYQEGLIARDEEALSILYALVDQANIPDIA